MLKLSRIFLVSGCTAKRSTCVARQPWISRIHIAAPSLAGQTWRLRHGQSRSGTEYGPLTDLPDWSFVDGTEAPPSKGQKKRRKKQEAIRNRMVTFIKEMKTAKTELTVKNSPN